MSKVSLSNVPSNPRINRLRTFSRMPKPKKRPKTEEEIRQQKRDCERKRRARIKADPALYQASKEKDRARYAEKKQKLQVKLVRDMTPREHRKQRKEWRERKSRSRLKKKLNKSLLNHLRENTPESTDSEATCSRRGSPTVLVHFPEENMSHPQSGCAHDFSTRSSISTPVLLTQNSSSSSQCDTPSRQKKTGFKIARTNREKSILIINKQKEQIKAMKRKIHTLQVKLLRSANRKVNNVTEKKIHVKVILNKTSKANALRIAVTKFLERDDNSKMCPGKKDCVVKNKIKKQRRYLSDTMLNLYKKFQTEQNTIKVSLATFCRLRPFWIVSRKISERDSCLCVVHENTQLMFEKLKYLDIISDQNLRELCKTVVCDMNSEACMLRKCEMCKTKVPKINEFDDLTEITYKLWTIKRENRLIHGKEKEIRRTVKAEVNISKKTLLLKFLEALDKFLVHQYYITHQYMATTAIKTNLKVGEIFMQVDFSENYCCKYSNEIQAVHFGASRQQITLHTGVYYYKCPDTQELKSKSFCTFSDCLRHDACAVFAHMQQILDQIHLSDPMDTMHVLSDGPTAQYRNKKAFYLFTQHLTQRYGLRVATWNFSEAGHGKGPMDGIGAVVKRTADRIVAQGKDIPDLVTLIKSIETSITNVIISVVTEKQIKDVDKLLSDQEKSIPETLKIHQVTWDTMNPKRIYLRKLTCVTCKPGEMCPHYSLKKGFFDFISSGCFIDNPGPSAEPRNSKNQQDVSWPGIHGNNVLRSEANENDDLSSEIDANYVRVFEADENQPCNSQSFVLKEGMWVVVRFLSKKTEKHFVGQVIEFDGEEPKVKFTKKKTTTKDHITFLWIEPEDIFPVPRDDIMAVLTEPTPSRRGELIFNNFEIKKYRNIV